MNAKQRLLAALHGEATDRIPLYTHIPFEVTPDGFEPGPFHGWEDRDPWRRQDPAYVRLVERMEVEGDNFYMWRHPSMVLERLALGEKAVTAQPWQQDNGTFRRTKTVTIGGRTLTSVTGSQTGSGHSWVEQHWCKSADDARRILDLPWDGAAADAGDFDACAGLLGEKGLMWCTIPSPIRTACALFPPTLFYELSALERELVHRLLKLMQERIMRNLTMLLEAGVGPIIRFGGAERATPPMMGPTDFDELYVAYDQPLIDLCKRHGRLVAVHCHGQIAHALERFVEMGIDQTDPVEAPPSGDVTMREARNIVGAAMTLTGNIQCLELETSSPEQIRERVRQIINDAGPLRLIITATGTPLKRISLTAEANYHAMMDAVLA
jgi:hypothetical protein